MVLSAASLLGHLAPADREKNGHPARPGSDTGWVGLDTRERTHGNRPPRESARNNGGRRGVIDNPIETDKGHSCEARTLAQHRCLITLRRSRPQCAQPAYRALPPPDRLCRIGQPVPWGGVSGSASVGARRWTSRSSRSACLRWIGCPAKTRRSVQPSTIACIILLCVQEDQIALFTVDLRSDTLDGGRRRSISPDPHGCPWPGFTLAWRPQRGYSRRMRAVV